MKILIVRRRRQFASALMSYWVVTSMPKAAFMQKYQLKDDLSGGAAEDGRLLRRMEFDPWEYGAEIRNGGTLRLQLEDDAATVFAVTWGGLLSNELRLEGAGEWQVRVTTVGGWRTPSCPVLSLQKPQRP